MRRESARQIHAATNLAYWASNAEWSSGYRLPDAALAATRPLWRGVHNLLLGSFFDTEKVLAVSGESVVAAGAGNKVDKHMFRYPGRMPIETFETLVKEDVGMIMSCLGDIALPTEVSVRPAYIFRKPGIFVSAVTQTQERLDLDTHGVIDLNVIGDEQHSPKKDRTVSDLEKTLAGACQLRDEFGRYPDVTRSGGNVRRSTDSGAVTLIDVMPYYLDGTRLVGDKPPGAIEGIKRNLARYEELVGQYGS